MGKNYLDMHLGKGFWSVTDENLTQKSQNFTDYFVVVKKNYTAQMHFSQ